MCIYHYLPYLVDPDIDLDCAAVDLGVDEEDPALVQLLVNNASYMGRKLTMDVRFQVELVTLSTSPFGGMNLKPQTLF